MVEIDFTTGKLLNNNRPTCEINMHLGIYKNRPDVKTIFHAHPIYTSVFSVLDTPLDLRLLSEAFIFLKKISYVDYAMPSSQELANKVSEKAKEANVLILRNHGAVVLGSNCEECFHKLEVLETLARIQYLILGRKDVHFISDDEMKRITENFHG
jgi:L-fuculose-phosphate aldolase